MQWQWLRDLSISRKFILSFSIVCSLCILLGAFTVGTFHNITGNSTIVSENAFPSVIQLDTARSAMNEIRRQDLDLLLCQTPACSAAHTQARQKAIAAYLSAVKDYAASIDYPGERELYQKFSTTFARYMESSDHGVELLAAGKAGDALDLLSSDAMEKMANSALTAISDDISMNAKEGMISARGGSRVLEKSGCPGQRPGRHDPAVSVGRRTAVG